MTEVQTPEVKPRSVYEAIADVMADVQAVAKTRSPEGGLKFAFRGIDAILTEVAPALRKHRLTIVPLKAKTAYRQVLTDSGTKAPRECTLHVTYRFVGPTGDWQDAAVVAEAIDYGDKATAKAWSVALRTLLIQVFAIPTGDKDPDEDVYERSAGKARYDRSGPGGSVVSPDPVDVENVLEAILTAFEEAAVIRGWNGEQKTTAMRNYIENSLGVKNVWDDKAGILWDKVSPGQKAIMLQACRKTLADLRGQSSPL